MAPVFSKQDPTCSLLDNRWNINLPLLLVGLGEVMNTSYSEVISSSIFINSYIFKKSILSGLEIISYMVCQPAFLLLGHPDLLSTILKYYSFYVFSSIHSI